MKNSKTIGVAIILLAIMNLALLVFLWLGYQHNKVLLSGRENQGGLKVLTEKLELTTEQMEKLERLRREHFQRMEPLRKESRQAREKLHSMWSEGGSEKKIDSLSNQIGNLQAQIERNTFNHFNEIRSLCTTSQKELFDNLIKDILKQGERREGPPDKLPDRRPPRR